MGIKEAINNILEKKREKKEEQKIMQREDDNTERLRLKKLSPDERALERYNKLDYQKEVQRIVNKRRIDDKRKSEMLNSPSNSKNIFKEDKKVFSNENIFMKKIPNAKHQNIFSGKNIFITKGVKL